MNTLEIVLNQLSEIEEIQSACLEDYEKLSQGFLTVQQNLNLIQKEVQEVKILEDTLKKNQNTLETLLASINEDIKKQPQENSYQTLNQELNSSLTALSTSVERLEAKLSEQSKELNQLSLLVKQN
ncbi:hypothetical protein AM305_02458 [Actinobacillus minor NM305]|uniref:Uncharacterized protein n=1 Tax=Actinobacillus minor NM305 TaxID=637911 RepID=C5S4A6_9PAST|nr:hypothetical protein AM305_02458 [Actinobacillus minor NM305]VFY96042.1 Uncharacterised protein [Actinobacillus indolicus]VTU09613.1 Uncharacterised protein [Actinobacillus indolicus]